MSIATESARPRAAMAGPGRASIREVSLVGHPPGAWATGRRVAWAGRDYRVVGASGRHALLRAEPVAGERPS